MAPRGRRHRPDRSGARLRPHSGAGERGNDPLRATSRGVGELVAAAVAEGAERIVVAVGGVASTDGGVGAVEACRCVSRPARGRVRRRRSLPRRRRGLRSAEGSDAGTGANPADRSRSSTSPTFPDPARREGSPEGWRRSARASFPASTSSPNASTSSGGSGRSTSSSPARDCSTRRRSRARSWAASSTAPAPPESKRSRWPETSREAGSTRFRSSSATVRTRARRAGEVPCGDRQTALAARRN